MNFALISIVVPAVIAVTGIAVAYYQGWLESPRRREERELAAQMAIRNAAVADAILGEEAVNDLAGEEITPKRPGLVARTATLEKAIATLVNQNTRITHVEERVDRLEIAEKARSEVRQEATAMWQAVANKDVIDVDPDE